VAGSAAAGQRNQRPKLRTTEDTVVKTDVFKTWLKDASAVTQQPFETQFFAQRAARQAGYADSAAAADRELAAAAARWRIGGEAPLSSAALTSSLHRAWHLQAAVAGPDGARGSIPATEAAITTAYGAGVPRTAAGSVPATINPVHTSLAVAHNAG